MKGLSINIGKLNKRITFLRSDWESDEMGQEIPVWKHFKTVWATVKAVRGNEYYEAQKLRSEVTYKIYTRFHCDITSDMKIVYKEKTFEIKTVIDVDEANLMLEIQCVEYVEVGDRDA